MWFTVKIAAMVPDFLVKTALLKAKRTAFIREIDLKSLKSKYGQKIQIYYCNYKIPNTGRCLYAF